MSDEPVNIPNSRYPTLDVNDGPVVMEASAYPTIDDPQPISVQPNG